MHPAELRVLPPSLPAITDAASARAAIEQIAALLAANDAPPFRAPPPEPTTCCGRGCNGCVWEGYLQAAAWWCEEAALWAAPQRVSV